MWAGDLSSCYPIYQPGDDQCKIDRLQTRSWTCSFAVDRMPKPTSWSGIITAHLNIIFDQMRTIYTSVLRFHDSCSESCLSEVLSSVTCTCSQYSFQWLFVVLISFESLRLQ